MKKPLTLHRPVFAGSLNRIWPVRIVLAFLFAFAAVVSSAPIQAQAQELTPNQARAYNSTNSELKKLLTNLQLAQQSAGSGATKPKGSRAKLAQLRLDQAIESVDKVQSGLDNLPAGNANVKSVQASLNAAVEAINSLNDRLNGKAATPTEQTKPDTGTPMPAQQKPVTQGSANDTVKLDYRQVESLKNAQYHLRTVEGANQKIAETLTAISAVKNPETVDYRVVRKALATLEEATRKAGFSNDNLQKVPANGKGVAEVASRLEKANLDLAAAKKSLVPLNEMLTKLIDPANYPNLQTDFKRLQEMSQMFRDPNCFLVDPPRAAAAWAQFGPAAEEGTRIATVYQRLVQQQTAEGQRIAGARGNLEAKQEAFRAKAEEQVSVLPEEIRGMFDKVKEMAGIAVKNKKPMYFTVGIPQQLGFVQQKLDLLKALNEDTSKPLFSELESLKDELKGQQKSLSGLIIEQNALPNDVFEGADRQQAIDIAIDGWRYQQKEFELLATRIPSQAWARETRWEYSGGSWYLVDKSKLQVILLIADTENEKFAIRRPVTVIKDHQKGDKLIGVPMYAGDDELLPNAYMLRSKIK